MREIKFRAWYKEENKMYYPEDKGYLSDNCWCWMLKDDLYKVMQYTGLLDKNGKEIYEGDIVNVHIFTQELGENMGVREGEKEFIASITFGSDGVVLTNNTDDSGPIWAYDGFHEESLQIIGNIYENPELIENA